MQLFENHFDLTKQPHVKPASSAQQPFSPSSPNPRRLQRTVDQVTRHESSDFADQHLPATIRVRGGTYSSMQLAAERSEAEVVVG